MRATIEDYEKAIEEMNKEIPNFVAEFDFLCCQSCGHHEMEEHGKKNYIFCHAQSVDRAFPREEVSVHYDEEGNECDEMEADTTHYEEGDRQPNQEKGEILYFHHHFEDESLKAKVVEAFNRNRLLVDWEDMSEIQAIGVS